MDNEATEYVLFADLSVGDVLVRSNGQRAEVIGAPEEWEDTFGRTLSRVWCRVLDGSDRAGWVPYGPKGHTLRLVRQEVRN